MKLSELNTDQATDLLCEITPYISNIAVDEGLTEVLKKKLTDGKTKSRAEIMVYGAKKITELAPIILKDHKTDVFGILAALNNSTIDDIAKQSFFVTLKQIKEIAQDKELVDFFKSWQQVEKTEQ